MTQTKKIPQKGNSINSFTGCGSRETREPHLDSLRCNVAACPPRVASSVTSALLLLARASIRINLIGLGCGVNPPFSPSSARDLGADVDLRHGALNAGGLHRGTRHLVGSRGLVETSGRQRECRRAIFHLNATELRARSRSASGAANDRGRSCRMVGVGSNSGADACSHSSVSGSHGFLL